MYFANAIQIIENFGAFARSLTIVLLSTVAVEEIESLRSWAENAALACTCVYVHGPVVQAFNGASVHLLAIARFDIVYLLHETVVPFYDLHVLRFNAVNIDDFPIFYAGVNIVLKCCDS